MTHKMCATLISTRQHS